MVSTGHSSYQPGCENDPVPLLSRNSPVLDDAHLVAAGGLAMGLGTGAVSSHARVSRNHNNVAWKFQLALGLKAELLFGFCVYGRAILFTTTGVPSGRV